MTTAAADAAQDTTKAADATTKTDAAKDTTTTTTTTTTADAGKTGTEAGKDDATKGAADQSGKTTETASAPKAPAKYQLAIPQGDESYVSAREMSRLEQLAKEADLSNEEAQAFLEDQITIRKNDAATLLAEFNADPTYGGQKAAETQRLAKLAVDKLTPPVGHPHRDGFLALVNQGHVFNNIALLSVLADFARKHFAEDAPGGGNTAGTGKKDAAEVLYGGTSS